MKRILVIIAFLLIFVFPLPLHAHEPIFGLGPHTIFKGGVGIEMEIEGEKASGSDEEEKEYVLHNEILYGITADLAITFTVPYVLNRKQDDGKGEESSSGIGDLSLRTKYRFWRSDRPGIQDSAAVIAGVKLPTGDDDRTPHLGSGSTDFLLALAAARESLKWYYFSDIRYRFNTEGGGGLRKGNRLFADLAVGIRLWPTEYLKPDLVLIAELNWETFLRNELHGSDIKDSGGNRLFLSPSFFITYRNLAVKGGLQIPLHQNLNGEQSEVDYRFKLAVELHI